MGPRSCVCTCGCTTLTTGAVTSVLDTDGAPAEPICAACWDGDDCDGVSPSELAAIEEYERRQAEGTLRTVPLAVGEHSIIMTTGELSDWFDRLDQEA